MTRYRIEFILGDVETRRDGVDVNVPFYTNTTDAIKALEIYDHLNFYFSRARDRDTQVPEVKTYRNGKEIDRGELAVDRNVEALRQGFITLDQIKRFSGNEMYELVKRSSEEPGYFENAATREAARRGAEEVKSRSEITNRPKPSQ